VTESVDKKNMQQISNIYQFFKHVNHHRKRIYILGTYRFSKTTKTRNEKILEFVVFKMHDIEKYLFLPLLCAKGLNRRETSRKFYDFMNRVGTVLVNNTIRGLSFFFKFTEKEIKNVKRFERILDVVDRHCDPVALEEFHINRKRPMFMFLNSKDSKRANVFEKRWYLLQKMKVFD
jgi:hypothetical protein